MSWCIIHLICESRLLAVGTLRVIRLLYNREGESHRSQCRQDKLFAKFGKVFIITKLFHFAIFGRYPIAQSPLLT